MSLPMMAEFVHIAKTNNLVTPGRGVSRLGDDQTIYARVVLSVTSLRDHTIWLRWQAGLRRQFVERWVVGNSGMLGRIPAE